MTKGSIKTVLTALAILAGAVYADPGTGTMASTGWDFECLLDTAPLVLGSLAMVALYVQRRRRGVA